MKVVINKCYGGFSLSPKAVKLLADKRGQKCYFFESSYDNKTGEHKYIPLSEGFPEGLFWSAFSTKNPNEKNYSKYYLDSRPSDRSNPLLVEVVETLGADADGACAELKVVDIPDGVEYDIEEYDGMEHIAEKHRTWG